jgi:hypothetical protein
MTSGVYLIGRVELCCTEVGSTHPAHQIKCASRHARCSTKVPQHNYVMIYCSLLILDDLPARLSNRWSFDLVCRTHILVTSFCVEGRLSTVVASHLKFEFASPQPHVSRNRGDLNVETYPRARFKCTCEHQAQCEIWSRYDETELMHCI